MKSPQDAVDHLDHIRSIMERSTTFMSLTGLSGVMAGIFGLLTTAVIAYGLGTAFFDDTAKMHLANNAELRYMIVGVAAAALFVTLATAVTLTVRKARSKGLSVWDKVTQRFAVHLFLPLSAGGLFTIALALDGQLDFVCPAMLLFFGLSLLNASRFVQCDMFWLGTAEVALGLVASFVPTLGLILWGAGFGLATLIYGTLMYYKYER